MSVTSQSPTRIHSGIDRFSIVSYTVYSLVAPSVTVALLIMLYALFPSAGRLPLLPLSVSDWMHLIGCRLCLGRG
jgi:hypothetical protein